MLKQSPCWMLAGLLVIAVGCARSEQPATSEKPRQEPATVDQAKAEPASAVPTDSKPAPQVETNTVISTPPAEKDPAPEPREVVTATPDPAPAKASASAEPQSQTKTAEKEPAKKPVEKPTATAAEKDARSKAEILNSQEFRRAVFEFGEWLTAQPIYTPAQVAEIKNQFNHRVAEMNAEQLGYLLADLQAKMKVLYSPDAVEARAWLAQYLSVVSDSKRAQLLQDVPNVATMTAAQLAAEISRIDEKRAQMDSNQTAFQRGQAEQVANQLATDRTSQQNFVRAWNSGPQVVSPYRGSSNVNDRLNNTPIGPGMTFYTGGFGGVGIAFSPSSW